jgi:hypothetical protein
MKTNRFASKVYQLVVVLALMALGGGESMAQYGTMRECQGTKGGTCVEVTLRYYEVLPKGAYSKVVILDPVTKQELEKCQICDKKFDPSCSSPCVQLQGATLHDASNLMLLQNHKSPGCYYLCSGGWCGWRCF